jgi:MGT family glycosyltransferase
MAIDNRRKFLFASAPLSGHLDWGGYLRTAAHLLRWGHDVLWVSEEPVRAAVETAGVRYHAVDAIGWRWPPIGSVGGWPAAQLPADLKPGERAAARIQRALLVMLSEDAVMRAVENLLAVADEFKPDALIGEPTVGAAALAAEKLNVPYAVCGYPATRHDPETLGEAERGVYRDAAARLKDLIARLGVNGRNWPSEFSPWPQSPELHVVYWTREWYADESDVLPQTRFVGGAVSPPRGDAPGWFDRLPQDMPLALVTLGSLFTDDPDFFLLAAHACARASVFPVIAMGRSERAPNLKQAIAPRLPRCIAVTWADYDHLFPRLSVAVHHGGMGTTHAAVVHGVPQVIVPHAADQSLQGLRAEASGVGLMIRPKETTLDALQRAVETVARDAAFRIRARNLAAEFEARGGVAAAARCIERLEGDEGQ